MRVQKAEFVRSVVTPEQLPQDHLPQIAFAGRSNVGKSSLINTLVGRKKLALTSSTPGKTRQLNFFRINDKLYFVDLPGYGYAKVSQDERRQWRKMIEGYLTGAETLHGVVHIIDARHGPTDLDLEMLGWLRALRLPAVVVATKADKLSRGALAREMERYQHAVRRLGVEEIVAFSAVTGLGKKQLWSRILHLVETR
jgi:GTP-binding protein